MTERFLSRRDLLRTAGGLAAVGSLAGCSQVTESLGGSGSKPFIQTVPENSQYVVETDFTVIYEDDGLRDGVNEELAKVRSEVQSQDVPENVTAALDQIETEAGLDPRSMSEAILSGTYEDGSDTDQVAYTLWSEWTEGDLLTAIEDEGGSYTEDSYGDTTLYVERESPWPWPNPQSWAFSPRAYSLSGRGPTSKRRSTRTTATPIRSAAKSSRATTPRPTNTCATPSTWSPPRCPNRRVPSSTPACSGRSSTATVRSRRTAASASRHCSSRPAARTQPPT